MAGNESRKFNVKKLLAKEAFTKSLTKIQLTQSDGFCTTFDKSKKDVEKALQLGYPVKKEILATMKTKCNW